MAQWVDYGLDAEWQVRVTSMTYTLVCVDERHAIPCPSPCLACVDENCTPPELRCDNCGYSGADRNPDAYPGEDCPKCGGEVK